MKVFALVVILVATFGISDIVSGSDNKFGKEISEIEATKIKDILADSDKYIGKTVKVEGAIIKECPSGCWFYLKDQTGAIYVDLFPSGFAISQRVEAKVIVEGIVKNRGDRIEIIGEGVEFK